MSATGGAGRPPARGHTHPDAAAHPPQEAAAVPDGPAADESCDYCGSTALEWRKCKLICRTCAQINKSCADL